MVWPCNRRPQKILSKQDILAKGQARSQDLEKGGGGFFERVRKVQTTLTRIFIILESVNWVNPKMRQNFSESSEIQTLFQPKNRWSPKKRSSPKLRLIFRPKSEIQTLFHSESRHLLHNFGTQFPLGEAVFNFSPIIGLKSTKNVRFCILHKPMGGARAPPAPPGYATAKGNGKRPVGQPQAMWPNCIEDLWMESQGSSPKQNGGSDDGRLWSGAA